MVFHELSHYTSFGRDLTKQYPVEDFLKGTPEYKARESGTSSAGRSVAKEIVENFVCGIFLEGCR